MQLVVLCVIGLAGLLVGWTLWLDHRRTRALLSIVEAAVNQGREPPAEVLEAIAGRAADDGGRRILTRGAAFAFAASGVALLASFLIGEAEKERALLLVALVLLLAGAALTAIRLFGQRLGL